MKSQTLDNGSYLTYTCTTIALLIALDNSTKQPIDLLIGFLLVERNM